MLRDPGAGKTVVTFVVTNYLREERLQRNETDSGSACIFLKRDDQEQSKINVLGCILSQLVDQKPHLPADLETLYHLAGSPPTPPTIDAIHIDIGTPSGQYTLLRASENNWHQVSVKIANMAKATGQLNSPDAKLLVSVVTDDEDEFQAALHSIDPGPVWRTQKHVRIVFLS